jgi:8-oxo-dGTP diphosphatase
VDGVLVEPEGVLLVRRANPPFQGQYALPGGFVDYGETVEAATVREMREETGLDVAVERLHGVYSDPARDPRGHTVGVVFMVRRLGGTLAAADDAEDARFFTWDRLPPLAFDHGRILDDVRRTLGANGPEARGRCAP